MGPGDVGGQGAGPPAGQGLGRTWLYALCHFVGRLLAIALLRAEVFGRENIPQRGRVILASNHRSYADPVFVGLMLSRPLHFVAKTELFENRLFGWFITSLHAFPVRRSGVDREALRRATAILESERALLLFPEGTRSRNDRLLPPRPGVGLLSVRTGAPIVPTYIHNSWRILPRRSWMVRPLKLYVCFGEPIVPPKPREVDVPSEVYADLAGRVMERIGVLRGELLQRIGKARPSNREELPR